MLWGERECVRCGTDLISVTGWSVELVEHHFLDYVGDFARFGGLRTPRMRSMWTSGILEVKEMSLVAEWMGAGIRGQRGRSKSGDDDFEVEVEVEGQTGRLKSIKKV